jgi:hypothetical protein
MSNEKVGEANVGALSIRPRTEPERPSLDALRFVHNWIWEHGEAEMWPAANLRDAARLIDAFSAANPAQATALSALVAWREAVKAVKAATAMLQTSTANTYPELWEHEYGALKDEAVKREAVLAAADALTEGEKTDI